MSNMNQSPSSPPPSVRVFSPRLNQYIDVSLSAENPEEDRLAGVQVVMLVTDHPKLDSADKK